MSTGYGRGAVASATPPVNRGKIAARLGDQMKAPRMCRFLAYQGRPIFIADLVAAPCRSLIHQSLHASEGKTETNGDGFGVGWYGERAEPGLYREVRPAWSDENLRSVTEQVRSRLFFAHVRAATTRANCHPYAVGRFLFMHNGQIGGYTRIRRRIEALIPDDLYLQRGGTTDTEAIFLAALAEGLEMDPVRAVASTLAKVRAEMVRADVREPLRFTAALTDGSHLWAFRWSSDHRPPSLYYRQDANGLVVVSEPIDEDASAWNAVPANMSLSAGPSGSPVLSAFG
jgi:glutamine amidotransferase